MSLLGIVDKVLEILKKPLRLRFDPSYRIEKELKRLEDEEKFLLMQPATEARRLRVDDIRKRRADRLREQSALAARS